MKKALLTLLFASAVCSSFAATPQLLPSSLDTVWIADTSNAGEVGRKSLNPKLSAGAPRIDSSSISTDSGMVTVVVEPENGNDALVTMIRRTKSIIDQHSVTTLSIPIDTIGTFLAPLSCRLPLGDYSVRATKSGFRSELKSFEFKSYENFARINLRSLREFRAAYKRWEAVKWIFAGLAVSAAIATAYEHNRLTTLRDEYDNATSTTVIQEKRTDITRYQRYYTISSIVSFSFLGGYGISWIMQSE